MAGGREPDAVAGAGLMGVKGGAVAEGFHDLEGHGIAGQAIDLQGAVNAANDVAALPHCAQRRLQPRVQLPDARSLFRGKAVDVSSETITIEATGSDDKLAALLEMLRPHGIIELVQSGQVALGRGTKTLTEKAK